MSGGNKKSGFMVVSLDGDANPIDYTYCRNSEDAIKMGLSSSSPCYQADGIEISSDHYFWKNPLTSDIEEVWYEDTKQIKKSF